jgi:hypothetical protein
VLPNKARCYYYNLDLLRHWKLEVSSLERVLKSLPVASVNRALFQENVDTLGQEIERLNKLRKS